MTMFEKAFSKPRQSSNTSRRPCGASPSVLTAFSTTMRRSVSRSITWRAAAAAAACAAAAAAAGSVQQHVLRGTRRHGLRRLFHSSSIAASRPGLQAAWCAVLGAQLLLHPAVWPHPLLLAC